MQYIYERVFFKSVGGKYFLVCEVLFERNAGRKYGGELHIFHRVAAGVRNEILFYNLSCDPADACG